MAVIEGYCQCLRPRGCRRYIAALCVKVKGENFKVMLVFLKRNTGPIQGRQNQGCTGNVRKTAVTLPHRR
jgi:hypothetical protein